eukprot:Rhum_TRINITY_DN15225_c2_g3::Rhum_TRINITY_DN15225_c2_g3_i2::g.145045::m.145045
MLRRSRALLTSSYTLYNYTPADAPRTTGDVLAAKYLRQWLVQHPKATSAEVVARLRKLASEGQQEVGWRTHIAAMGHFGRTEERERVLQAARLSCDPSVARAFPRLQLFAAQPDADAGRTDEVVAVLRRVRGAGHSCSNDAAALALRLCAAKRWAGLALRVLSAECADIGAPFPAEHVGLAVLAQGTPARAEALLQHPFSGEERWHAFMRLCGEVPDDEAARRGLARLLASPADHGCLPRVAAAFVRLAAAGSAGEAAALGCAVHRVVPFDVSLALEIVRVAGRLQSAAGAALAEEVYRRTVASTGEEVGSARVARAVVLLHGERGDLAGAQRVFRSFKTPTKGLCEALRRSQANYRRLQAAAASSEARWAAYCGNEERKGALDGGARGGGGAGCDERHFCFVCQARPGLYVGRGGLAALGDGVQRACRGC